MTADQLTILSFCLLSVALLIISALLIASEIRRSRSSRNIGRAIQNGSVAQEAARWQPPTKGLARVSTEDTTLFGISQQDLPTHWLKSSLGRALVADEDRKLIDQCGFETVRAQLVFLGLRLVLAAALPIISYLLVASGYIKSNSIPIAASACLIGFMCPKWTLARIASGRREQVTKELPLFVDLLKLLQGVGLSLDQSLQIMADDFGHALKILSKELRVANRQYSQGRTREHSLARLSSIYDNDNLSGLVALLVQVDRHGGAVQEPLQQFSERLRESRRSDLKGRIGKITVKMTGVMVITLLPALVIVTAGPGFIAVFSAVGGLSK